MNLTESQLLQARIAGMSNLEFDEWLAGRYKTQEEAYDGYHDGEQGAETSYSHGYSEGYEDGLKESNE